MMAATHARGLPQGAGECPSLRFIQSTLAFPMRAGGAGVQESVYQRMRVCRDQPACASMHRRSSKNTANACPPPHPAFTTQVEQEFKILWADHGDAVSTQYAGGWGGGGVGAWAGGAAGVRTARCGGRGLGCKDMLGKQVRR